MLADIFFCLLLSVSSLALPNREVIKCEEDREIFTYEKGCVDIFESSLCEFGERLYGNENRVGVCDCTGEPQNEIDFVQLHQTFY